MSPPPPTPAAILTEAINLTRQRRPDLAEQLLRRGLQAYPKDAPLNYQLAVTCFRLGKSDAALPFAQSAADLEPANTTFINTLASLLHVARRLYEAELWARKGLAIDERSGPLHNTLGTLLAEQQRIEEACDAFRRALDLQPDRYDSNINLARLLARLGLQDEALQRMARAASLRPDDVDAQSGFAFDQNYRDDADPRATLQAHRHVASLFERAWKGPLPSPLTNSRDPERKLRVAYLSADYRAHSVSYFLEPILARQDREKFEVFLYSSTEEPDATTGRLRSYPSTWREVRAMSDADLHQLARNDGIDLVVDLSGLTIGHRLPALAHRLAPVQINYLGYPNTTGLPAMDYRIVDAITDPPGSETLMVERPIRMPGCFLCYRPPENAPAPTTAVQDGPITFGSFNNIAKASPMTVSLWSRVLQAVPGSRLLLRSRILAAAIVQTHLRGRFASHGIDPARVDLIDHLPAHTEHMGLYGRVDVALDTYPYHGTTTTCEALWMGVPVVALRGNVHAARVGASLLTTVGRPDLIAESADDFVRIAAGLVQNRADLAANRAKLREQMKASTLCDEPRFVRAFDEVLRTAWRSWCAGAAS